MSKAKKQVQSEESFNISAKELELLEKKLSLGSVWNGESSNRQIGDKIAGKILSFEIQKYTNGKNKTEKRYAKLLTKDGQVTIGLTTVLESKFDELNIGINSIIMIEYTGEKINKMKKEYHVYNVSKL